MIQINKELSVDENKFIWDFIHSSGPGGQNVNKVSSSVQLRIDIQNCEGLTDKVKDRIFDLASNRINKDGFLVIQSREHRTQAANRQAALDKLVDLLRRATIPPRKRKKTRPTRASQEARLNAKKRHSQVKRMRQAHSED